MGRAPDFIKVLCHSAGVHFGPHVVAATIVVEYCATISHREYIVRRTAPDASDVRVILIGFHPCHAIVPEDNAIIPRSKDII